MQSTLSKVLKDHPNILDNISRVDMIEHAVENKEALVSANGNLVTWTPPESTGRSPKDTVIVKRSENENTIDWNSPNCIPIEPKTFDLAFEDAINLIKSKEKIYITDRVIGADPNYALPTRVITDRSLTVLFTDNMFRAIPEDLEKSCFADKGFTLLVLPYNKLDRKRYDGLLRKLPNGKTSNMIVAMDFERRFGVIIGSAYGGSVKKLMFTVMNYYLPAEGILPLHCSANEGKKGDSALLLGLSGTGKTTLSADPSRALLGDDEHGWSNDGIANFENGCYAKLINLNPEKEPEIYNAVFHDDEYTNHGAIVENCMMYPNGTFDLDDERLTPNSRASYLLSFLSNIKPSSISGHPKTILFLTADANAVLPPVAKLNPEQAMLWFLMGYTSKLAGTETGIVEPVTTFSRFFGEPFMPRNPDHYATLLGEKMKKFNTKVYLINTGWSGGPYGIGKRMDINLTRSLVNATLEGTLENVEYYEDKIFHIMVPKTCPGVDSSILTAKNTWDDKEAYDVRAKKLASEFSAHFDKAYGDKDLDPAIMKQCPNK
ncbi:MAG: phosphoenolpyruvate carboxykinase (ATP) [Candidatus Cloacimonetes bacterium]|nr:phosphoenolpyruvate carboxykinase (ATP) [Candidatus Cloacimonadota bacterium]MCF7813804.1 phosphoenolpyruvate carboxykinase (ATP) [Candidatus Cloacimonadota bacterium]MCF7868483.1 phosphoenolpyruvate carboxykinase (ATP) [Candidatus Cloacimonadota bacterium]